jgi:hypothetical protein
VLREERFTEIYSSRRPGDATNGSYGSGFLLGGGLILTALHVVVPASWGGVPAKLEISARPLGAGKRNTNWLAADLVWPAQAALAEDQPDIALLRLRDPIPEASRGALPPLGLQDDGAGEQEFATNVIAVGFPRFKSIKGLRGEVGRRDSHQISGVVQPYSALVSESFEIHNLQFGTEREQRPADAASDWVGFSGAPLIANRSVIGVVVTALDKGRFDFRAARLKPLLDRADFLEVVSNAATVTSETAKVEVPPVERLVCLLDRDNQEDDFIDMHKRCCPAPTGTNGVPTAVRPLICLLPGAAEYQHEPEDVTDRLALKTLPELAWPEGMTKFEWIDWPAAHLESQIALARLRGSLWNRLCGGRDAPEQAQAFRDLWRDGSRARLFKSDLTQRPLNANTAQVLTQWCAFLAQIAPQDHRPLAHLMMIGATLAQAREWRALAAIPPRVIIDELTPLDRCTPIHLRTWLAERLPPKLSPAQTRVLERLRDKLPSEYEKPFYVSPLKNRVRELVKEGVHA